MSARTDVVPYVWNTLDGLAAQCGVPCTPYKLAPALLNDAPSWRTGEVVRLPLGFSSEPASVARFFRDGYEWVPVPDGVWGATLFELFSALFAHDKRRFAHLDPVVVMTCHGMSEVARVRAIAGDHMAISSASCDLMRADPALLAAHIEMTSLSYVEPSVIPFADLAFVHFEHWANSALRCAILDEMLVRPPPPPAAKWDFTLAGLVSPRLPLAVPYASFFEGLLATILPQAIPCERNGKKIERVLARRPARGVPIRTAAVPEGRYPGHVQVISLEPPFIELDGWDAQTIAPIYLNEWRTRSSKLRFRVTLPLVAHRTVLEIVSAGAVLYSESHDRGELTMPGVHLWSWDGYDQNGVFDTMVFKKNELSARLTYTDLQGHVAVATTELAASAGKIRWLDAKIDAGQRSVDVTVYARFSKPSELDLLSLKIPLPDGLGNALRGAAESIGKNAGFVLGPLEEAASGLPDVPFAPSVSSTELFNENKLALSLAMPKPFDLDEVTFQTYKADVLFGIQFHWSRSVSLDGETFDLRVGCRERPTDAVRTFLMKMPSTAFGELGVETDLFESSGGCNLATFMEGLPVIDVWNEVHFGGPLQRRSTGGHELGHSVLREAYSPIFSLCHKGSSTVLQTASAKAGMYGQDGEIDLMCYWAQGGGKVADADVPRVRATEDDARALVWMAKVVVG